MADRDGRHYELAASDDTPLVYNDAVASIIVPEDGRYVIQVRDASYNGDGRAYYLLHVGNFPRPHAALPAGGRPGETVKVKLLGDVAGEIEREVTIPEEPSERFALDVADEHGMIPRLAVEGREAHKLRVPFGGCLDQGQVAVAAARQPGDEERQGEHSENHSGTHEDGLSLGPPRARRTARLLRATRRRGHRRPRAS